MTSKDLQAIIKDTCLAAGFTNSIYFTFDNDKLFHMVTENDLYSNPALNGKCLEIELVNRHNGTEADINYVIRVISLVNSSIKVVDQLKVVHTNAYGTVKKKVLNFIKNYYNFGVQI